MKTPLTLFFILFLSFSQPKQTCLARQPQGGGGENFSKKKKPIMMFFTGSDWCGWVFVCKKKYSFKKIFKKWASENVVLLELDFPRRKALSPELKEQNSKLQRQFAIQGYPTVWFVEPGKDSQNNLKFDRIGRTGYVKGGPGAWISNANALLDSK